MSVLITIISLAANTMPGTQYTFTKLIYICMQLTLKQCRGYGCPFPTQLKIHLINYVSSLHQGFPNVCVSETQLTLEHHQLPENLPINGHVQFKLVFKGQLYIELRKLW